MHYFCFPLLWNGARMWPWRRQWHPTPALLPGKSQGQRSLVGCSPLGRQESDTTERLPFHFSLSFIGEGNSNPLQCSCLENPRDGGARQAVIYGVAQSQTQLKRLKQQQRNVTTWKLNPISKSFPFCLGKKSAKASVKQQSFCFSLWNVSIINPYLVIQKVKSRDGAGS